MPPIYYSLVFGIMGLVSAWSIVRAWNTGRLRDEGVTLRADTNPIGFGLAIAIRFLVVGIGVCEVLYGFGLVGEPFAAMKAGLHHLG